MSAKAPDNRVALENDKPRWGIAEKVCGRGKYTMDIYPKDALWARWIRFPHGAGKVVSKNLDAAKSVPGVVDVTWEKDEARFVGDRLGYVVAKTELALEDAIAALDLKVELGEVKAIPAKLLEQSGGYKKKEDDAALTALFKDAAVVYEGIFETQVQFHTPLEPHCIVADVKDGKAELWASTQGTFAQRSGSAEVLKIKPQDVIVHNEYIGGGFGAKLSMGPETRLACLASQKLGQPVRVMYNRREEHLDVGNRPGSLQYIKLAADKNGKLIGGRAHQISLVGYDSGGGGVNPCQCYNHGQYDRDEDEFLMTAGLPRAFRAPAHPQGYFSLESVLDELAAKLGMDPLEFRKRNDVSERRKRQMDQGAELIGWSSRKPNGSATGRKRLGYGYAAATWNTWPTRAGAEVEIHRDGSIVVKCGTQDIGTGTYTVVTDVVAAEWGIPRDRVTPRIGDSRLPESPGSGGSQTARSVTPAVRLACQEALKQLTELVGKELGAKQVNYAKGEFSNSGGRKLSWEDACSLMTTESITGRGNTENKLFGEGSCDGCQFALVEVDTDTGEVIVKKIVAVQAAGEFVNRLAAENQVYGGVIQGISYALYEERVLDPVTGGLLNDNFLFYKIAGTVETPEIVAVLDHQDGDTGVRGIGEPVTIPTSAAIANAVANAIGARVTSLPITPDKVLAALQEAQAAKKGATA